jgi:MFS family permease
MIRIIRMPNLLIFLLANFISGVGNFALWLAMAVWLKELTGSSAAAGATLFAFGCGALLSPLGGAVADRFRRRPLLIAVNIVAIAPVLLLTLVHHVGQAWLVYAVMFVLGVLGTVVTAAQTALLPMLVPAELLSTANGLQQSLTEATRLFAPALGAGLFALVGGWAVAEIDALTFLIAAAALLAVRVREPAPQRSAARWTVEISAGLRFLAKTTALRQIALALGCTLLVFGFTESVNFSVVTAGLGYTASFLGVLLAVQSIGGIAGAVTAGPLLQRIPEGVLIACALLLAVTAPLLLAVPNLAAVLAGFAIGGIAVAWVIVAAITALQRRTPTELMGRVSGSFNLVLTVPQVVSVGTGSALLLAVGYRNLLFVISGVVFVCAIYLATRREQREPAGATSRPDREAAGTDAGPGSVGTWAVPGSVGEVGIDSGNPG